MGTKVEELFRIQSGTAAPNSLLDAYVTIRPPDGEPTRDAETAARQVVQRIERQLNTTVRYHFLDLLGCMHVQANTSFFEHLLEQPEVISAKAASDTTESAMIEPKDVRRARLEDANAPVRRRRTP